MGTKHESSLILCLLFVNFCFYITSYHHRESKSANISLAEAKRKAILNGRRRRLSDKADHVKKTVLETVEQRKSRAEKTVQNMNRRLKNAECKRSSRLNTISVRFVYAVFLLLDHDRGVDIFY